MAEAALIDEQIQAPETELKPARPPGSGKRGPLKGSKIESNETPAPEFWERLEEISDTDWQGHALYIYRCDPVWDNTNGGRDTKYIGILNSRLTEDSLLDLHGSGTYKCVMKRGSDYLLHAYVTVMDPKRPPHIPPGDWLLQPRNVKWKDWRPAIEKWWNDSMRVNDGNGNGNGNGVPPYMVQFMTDVRSELNRRTDVAPGAKDQLMSSIITILPSLLQQQSAAQDPSKIIDAVIKMREMTTPPPIAAPIQDNSMMTFVLGQLTRMQESNDKLVAALLAKTSEAVKQPSAIEQIETFAKVITAVKGITPDAGVAGEPTVLSVVSEGLPKLFDLGEKFFTMRALRPNGPAPQRQPAPVQQNNNPAPVAVVSPPPAVPPTPVDQSKPGVEEVNPAHRQILVMVADLAEGALKLGLDGGTFADQIVYRFGQSTYDSFIVSVPKDQLLPAMRGIPEAWQHLQAFEAELPAFIEAFYAPPEEDEEPPAESPEPVKPAAKKKVKK